jgi:hypothetical protein
MLTQLHQVLRPALGDPSRLRRCIAAFLTLFDSIPDDHFVRNEPGWRAIEDLAYELRYYAPEEAAVDSTLVGDREALDRIRQLLEQTPRRVDA